MPRKPLIAGNWKLNLTIDEGIALIKALAAGLAASGSGPSAPEVVVCPGYLSIQSAVQAAAGRGIGIGAQDCFWEAAGAFTGEVSATQLKATGATHVILGHSERRQYFHETDETVNRRLIAALGAGLIPIVCVGETLAERDAGALKAVLHRQVPGALAGIARERLDRLILAYEPVWAIGTGRTATHAQAQEAHAIIRGELASLVGDLAGSVRILYGGSVKPDNTALLLGGPDVDGALVGGASLKAGDFLGIIAAALPQSRARSGEHSANVKGTAWKP